MPPSPPPVGDSREAARLYGTLSSHRPGPVPCASVTAYLAGVSQPGSTAERGLGVRLCGRLTKPRTGGGCRGRMAGRMGTDRVKVENLKVVKVVPRKNLLVVKGCVPGHKNAFVTVQK